MLQHLVVERPRSAHATALIVFVAATAAAVFAYQTGRPITSAILYLLGVTVVGALEGAKGGIIGALAASLIYNFFLSEPAFSFSLATLEDYVPLIAFNLSAAASGVLTGRLRDRALAAETATGRVAALLALSQKLQTAVEPADVLDAVSGFAGKGEWRLELFLCGEGSLEPVGAGSVHDDLAASLFSRGRPAVRHGNCEGLLLSGPSGPMGVLVLEPQGGAQHRESPKDLDALASLVSITLERCLLLRSLSEADLVKRSEELKTALLTSVSHDLRTPLSAIAASASSLARYGADLSEKSRADLLEMIQEQCRRLDRYTTNLLNLSRVQAGIDSNRFTRCDALEALGSAIVQVRRLGSGRDIVKAFALSEALVTADPVMLEQVFYNVLENAVRYGPPGSAITVSASMKDERLFISVGDRGPGIPQEDIERIFQRFYRGSAARPHEGSGLGLAIARGFTEAFGGRISAASGSGERSGTCITIELPAEAAERGRG